MFIFDVETLGIESTCVILSAGLIYFDPEKQPDYQQLLDDACFVKLKSKDQVERLGRTISKDTIEWWKNQHEYTRKVSFDPSSEDLFAEDAIQKLKDYMAKFPTPEKRTMWARGSLDQVAIDSLCVRLDINPITTYNMWRDVRTAVDCFTGSTNGYCEVDHPTFKRHNVIKHHPVHDCALDAMQLMYGK